MVFPPTNYQTGQVLTAELLNGAEARINEAIGRTEYDIYNLLLQSYYDGKIIPKQGLMFDGLSDSFKIDTASTVVPNDIVSGVNTVTVASTTGFYVGQLVVINDTLVAEEKIIKAINGLNIQFKTALQNSFAAGARITRSYGLLDTASNKFKAYNTSVAYSLGGLEAGLTGNYSWYDWGSPGSIGLGNDITLPTSEPYYITSVRFKISQKNSPTGNLYVTLHSSPAGPVLATSVSKPASSANGDWLDFSFSTPYKYAFGNTIYAMVNRDVSDGVNYFRYEGTISGSAYTHASGYGYWDIIGHDPSIFVFGYPASDPKRIDLLSKKVVFPSAFKTAKLWVTYSNGTGIAITPKISIVNSGQEENFVGLVSSLLVDNGDGTVEESFSLFQENTGTDVVLWLKFTRPDTISELAIRRYGLAVGV